MANSKYPIIIIGAGASFDYKHIKITDTPEWRPPLTDHIFSDQYTNLINNSPYAKAWLRLCNVA